MISQETIEKIKNTVRLVDVVSQRVELRQRGTNYVGLCPFHQEKTPSFHVRDLDNFYHCFGCGASGNVITFVMTSEGLSFPEAVEQLCERYGIGIKYTGTKSKAGAGPDKQKFYEINLLAHDFFVKALALALRDPHSLVAAYLKQRHISNEAVKTFGIGYAPPSWNGLVRHLSAYKIPESMLLDSGLAKRNAKGELYDVFRARLIFPVYVEAGRIAGFGGRIIPGVGVDEKDGASPKYLNSPETILYQKSRILYGLIQALDAIRAQKELYLVEGYMDLIGLWQAGVRNVAATCGTAVTTQHARRLSGLAGKVYLLFDGDSAGRTAAARAFEVFINSGMDVSAIFLPEGEDPDTIAGQHGKNTIAYLEGLKAKAQPLWECLIRNLLDKFGAENVSALGAAQKGKLCEELGRYLTMVESKIEKSDLIAKSAFKLMVDPVHLEELTHTGASSRGWLQGLYESSAYGKSTDTGRGTHCSISALSALDRNVLQVAITGKTALVDKVLRDAEIMREIGEDTRQFIQEMAEILCTTDCELERKKELIKQLLTTFGPSWTAFWKQVHRISQDESVDVNKLLAECHKSARKINLKREILRIDQEILICREAAKKEELLQEKLTLGRILNSL